MDLLSGIKIDIPYGARELDNKCVINFAQLQLSTYISKPIK